MGANKENITPLNFPAESESGNVEYKLKLISPTKQRLEHLVTQMKWRLREGHGEAIYEIGVSDDGAFIGLNKSEMEASMNTLYIMAAKLGATLTVLKERIVDENSLDPVKTAEVLIRKIPENRSSIDLRIAVLGHVDAGKSTLLGVLTQGELDNGKGKARMNMFRHKHEFQTGRTSSGRIVTYETCQNAEQIVEESDKLITFIDLAGHRKYLRTTVAGLTGYPPHYVMLVVSVSASLDANAEHLDLITAIEVPVFLVVTKIDTVPPEFLKQVIKQIKLLLKSPRYQKEPFVIQTEDDVTHSFRNIRENVVPVMLVSNVSGKGLELLNKFLNVLPPGISLKEKEKLEQEPIEFQIDETFHMSGTGIIVGGFLAQGVIIESIVLYAGPKNNGEFELVEVVSIHCNKVPCQSVNAGHSATLNLKLKSDATFKFRKGMVLISENHNMDACICFQASIYVVYHPHIIRPGFQATIHINNICQTAVIIAIMCHELQSNQKSSVLFKFLKQPEYVKPKSRILFRQGRSQGFGRVVQTFAIDRNAK